MALIAIGVAVRILKLLRDRFRRIAKGSGQTSGAFGKPIQSAPAGEPTLAEMMADAESANEPLMYRLAGNYLSMHGRYDEAEIAYRRAITAGDSDGRSSLGAMFAKIGRQAEAEDELRRGAASGSVEAEYNLGTLLLKQDRFVEAETYLRSAAKASYRLAPFNLARALEGLGRHAEAADAYRQAIEFGDEDASSELARLLALQERLGEAAKVFDEASRKGDANARYGKAVMLWRDGRYAEAEAEYRAVVALGDRRAVYGLGVLLGELGRREEARTLLTESIDSGVFGAADELVELRSTLGDDTKTSIPFAEPTPWKVALLEEMNRTAPSTEFAAPFRELANQFRRRLDEKREQERHEEKERDALR